MGERIKNYLFGGRKFKREFKRQIRTLIIVTLGFTIAFTWRQTIFDLSQSFVRFITHAKNSSSLTILTSIFITLFSVFIIYFTSKLLKDDIQNY